MLIQFGWIERASATVNVLAPSEKGGAFMYEILIAESRLTKKNFMIKSQRFAHHCNRNKWMKWAPPIPFPQKMC